DQTNFPMTVNGTYSSLATVANGGHVLNSNGYDIGFYGDSACSTTPLNWETELYNPTTGLVDYWVKVPTLSHTADTTIYLCYGNPGITTNQATTTGVWDSSYFGVYHFGDGTSLSGSDS